MLRATEIVAAGEIGEGESAVMIALLGGMGTFFGPMVGAAAFLLLENLVSLWTVHWQLIVGAIFMICVLFFPAGIWGTLISRGKP